MKSTSYSEKPFFDEDCPTSQSIHRRCLPVSIALKECAKLSVKAFALIVLDESGEEKMYTSASLTPHQQRIFTNRFRADFLSSVQRVTMGAYSQDTLDGAFDSEHQLKPSRGRVSPSGWRIRNQVQPHSRFYGPDNNEASTHRKRKRSRDSFYQERYAESDNTAVLFQKTQQLVIGGDIEVELFYSAAFKNMQQMCCKVMAKAFVKLIEPKKQAHYPYTRGDAHAPPWWPDTAGENSVRHKEPDHLLKPERIRLLVHILRVVTMPREKQCVSIQKLGLNARKLEEATMESMSHWFNENQHPENATKQVILEEIFKVAHVEERYRNGEIDGTTCVPVLCSHTNKVDNPDAGEPNELVEGEAVPIPVTIPTPQNLVLPTITMQSRPQQNADPGDFYRPHITAASACHYSQSRLEEYDLYGDSSNPTHEFYPQSPGQHDPYHWPILSSPYQRPSNLYMVGRTT